jgi:hypothetical protein
MLKTPFRVLSHFVITALFLTQSTQPPTEAQEGSSAFAWNIRYLKDPMHDTTRLRATLSEPSETAPGATTVGTATCDDDGLNLDIGHFAATGDDPGFKINYPPQDSQTQTGFVGIGLAGMVAATIAAVAMSGQRDTSAWVNYNLKIDDRFLRGQSAKPLYTNVIRLRFKRGDMDPIVNAKRIVMEIPEPDDTPVYFEFHPDDPTFQMAAAACGARVPLTPAIIAAGYANRALTDKEISETLSSVLSESARFHNLPPNVYSDEITRIVQIVNVCNMVNDAMLTAATSGKTVDLTRLGRGFAECEPSAPINISREVKKVPASSPPKPTDIYFSGNVLRTYLVSRQSAGPWGGWGGFMMSVFIGGADHPVFKNVCAKFMPNFVSSPLPQMWIFQGQRGLSNGNSPLEFGQYIVGPNWIPLSAKVLLSYRVEGTKNATVKVELLRADDNNGHPGEWSIIATDSKTMGGDGWSDVNFEDVPSKPGRYWYGTHIIESSGKEAREPSSVRVTVASQEDLAATSPLSPESLFPGGAELVLVPPPPISPALPVLVERF